MTVYMHRYPIILNCFLINNGTGGNGQYRGGNGLKRELMFRRQLKLSVLTERRVFHPYGLDGNNKSWHHVVNYLGSML